MFVSYHSQIYNHYHHERHLQNRRTYKQKSITALIERFQICVVGLYDSVTLRRVKLSVTTQLFFQTALLKDCQWNRISLFGIKDSL